MTWVATRKKDCRICDASQDVFQAVNEVLWEGGIPTQANRSYGHRPRAIAVLAAYGMKGDPRLIDRHRNHVEWSARDAGSVESRSPQGGRETTLYATDFVSVTDRMAQIGMQAAEQVGERLREGTLDDKALVGVMQTGLRAANNREQAARAEKTQSLTIQAIFAVSGGFLAPPEQRLVSGHVEDAGDLRAIIIEERARLKELQQG